MIDHLRITEAFTSNHWRWVYPDSSTCPATLLDALKSELPHIPVDSWNQRLAWGGAYINGIPVFADAELKSPCKVEYYEMKFAAEDAEKVFPKFREELIVFEDDDIIIAFKPAMLPCMPAREQLKYNLKNYIEAYCGKTVHAPSRLDMSTAGLVPMSKTPEMHNPLQRLFEKRQIDKRYLLASQCSEEVSWKATSVRAAISRHPEHAVLRRVVSRGGVDAHTDFKALAWRDGVQLIEAKPLTGRTHQIRVHVQYLGLPIVGDNFYGGATAAELSLMCYRLSFRHPRSGKQVSVQVPQNLLPSWAQVWEAPEIAHLPNAA